jgi:hypothetical protein
METRDDDCDDAAVFELRRRSTHLRVVLAAALTASTAALSADSMPDAGSASFDWNAAIRPYECRKDQHETGSACARRLRETIHSELSQPVLAPLSDRTCSEAPTNGCSAELDGCAPRVAAVIFAFFEEASTNHAFTGAEVSAQVPDLIAAAKSSNAQLRGLAIRTLAELQRPETLPFLRAELRSGRDDCEWSGFFWLDFRFKETGAALARDLVPILATPDWDFRVRVAKLLAHYADPRTAGALVRLLERPPFHAQIAAAEGLGRMGGPVARSAVPTLQRLATRHWATEVRRAAARAATVLSGKEVLPREPKCVPILRETTDHHWKGTVLGEPIDLTPLQNGPIEEQRPCSGVAKLENLAFAVSEEGDCVIGIDRGEFGGSIQAFHNGSIATLRAGSYVNPRRVVRAHGETLIIEGGAHITLGWGALTRLRHNPDGSWSAEPIDQLPGTPFAFGKNGQGDLLVLTNDLDSPGGCDGKDGLYLIRPRPDGTLESLP